MVVLNYRSGKMKSKLSVFKMAWADSVGMLSKRIHFLMFGLSFLVSSICASAQQSPERIAALKEVQKADNLMSLLIWQDALFAYDNAMAIDPTFAQAYMKKAELLAKLGRRTEAEKVYQKALKINPYAAYIYDGRAKMRMLAKDYKGALQDLDTAVGLRRDDAEIRDHLVDDLIAMQLYERAVAEIDSLLAMDYRVIHELEKKALVFMLSDDLDSCLETIETILSIRNDSPFAYDLKGVVHLKEGNPELAVTALSEAIRLDSSMVVAYHNRAIAHRLLGDPQAALHDLNTAIDIRQDMEKVYYSRAILKKEMGNIDDALDDYNTAIRINSEFEDAIYNRAYTLKLMGDYAAAMSDLEEVLFENPESAEAWNMKGNIEVLYAKYSEAIQYYDQALSLDPELASVYYNRGLAKLMNNQFRDGCQDLQTSLDMDFQKAEKKLTAFWDQ